MARRNVHFVAVLQIVAAALSLASPASAAPADRSPAPKRAETSYAWITFDRSGLIGSGSSGLASLSPPRALTIDQPVRIASISKLVVALGVMRLVEAGRLDLDQDVSRLLGSQLRNPAYPDRAITLRMLLSHRSGLQDKGERYSVPLGRDLRDLISGKDVFDTDHAPGSHFRYANINFPVIATLMERATGERFDRLMDRLVIRPLGLNACFGWATCRRDQIANGVTLHHPDGRIRFDDATTRLSSCPVASVTAACDLSTYVPGTNGSLFSPQGGLRISARDLATIGRMMLAAGRHEGRSFLKPASLAEMVRPNWRFAGDNGDTSQGFFCAYGLGVQSLPNPACKDQLFADGRAAFGHAGEAYGLLSGLWMNPRRGNGVAYFIINHNEAGTQADALFRPLEKQLANKLAR